jgi:hypothetical protein
VATASCNGALIAREAKAWLPSAWDWANGQPKDHAHSARLVKRSDHAHSARLVKRSVRQPDPFYAVKDGWIIRRIGPHCGRIELAQFPKNRDERLILRDMGRETANLHLATLDQREAVLRDLTERKADWLIRAADAMSKATEQDWEAFRTSKLADFK